MTWQIEQGCPQCGAPKTLDETDRLLACAFCRTRLYLVSDGPFRYHIPPAVPCEGELFYLPYWRIRGAAFSVTAAGPAGRIADTSRRALSMPVLPPSLGLRPQVLRLRFSTPETPGRFIRPDLPAAEALPAPKRPPRGLFYSGFVGDTLSLIHAPCELRGEILYDAVLGRPFGVLEPEARDRLLAADTAPTGGSIRFIPTLCPRCGWDLEGERDSLVLLCRNCDSAWHCPQQALEEIPFTILTPPAGTGEIASYLPFWRMRPRVAGLALDSRADLVRLANLPKVVTADMEAAPLEVWSPAFKIHPALYIRWSRQMTVFAPAAEETRHLPAAPLHPVTLPLAEACEGIVVTIAELIANRRQGYPLLADLRVTLAEARLEYHPFQENHTELRHPLLGVTLDRTALRFGSVL